MAGMLYFTPVKRDLPVVAGNSFHFGFTIKVNDVAYDNSGWKARLHGRVSVADVTPVIVLDESAGITLGGAAGTVDCHADPDVTRTWPNTSISYQLELEDAAGEVQTFFYGTIPVSAEIAQEVIP